MNTELKLLEYILTVEKPKHLIKIMNNASGKREQMPYDKSKNHERKTRR